MPIPNAMVFGQDDPSASSRLCEPVFILRIRRKVVIVNMKNGPSGCFEGELAPDSFFNFEAPASIIVC